ncbi:MAG TPA: NUDIX hydrolase [Rhodopila sp.]|nr:NUDIX hydrolase [Rhodopila sp.]
MSDREYPARPIIGIGIVVIRRDATGEHVLLCQRGKPPNLGSWTLPGGAQDIGETCEQAARRELMEECGLEVGPLHFCAHVDTIRRDAEGRVQFHYTILDFAALWLAGEPVAGSDVSAVAWAPVDDLERYGLWSEAYRIIGIARKLLATDNHTRLP